ncbi:MAG TPA: N-acetyltransferase, partial [Clostridiaceae bacterium]|nr:N-acetyltransferase [Clostridiaceae bacterium]
MLIYELKNGMKLSIRRATESDTEELINMEAQIGGESDNLTFGRDDFYLTE